MKIEFIVNNDLPPKKDGANSMWGKGTELVRLQKLRRAALNELIGLPPLCRNIHIRLEVCMPGLAENNKGDLDNFITGICDGLMAANPRAKLDSSWFESEFIDIHPSISVAIVDDRHVMGIEAYKKFGDPGAPCYKVVLEGDN